MMTTRYTRVHSHGHAQRHISAKFKLEHSSTTHLTHFHKVPSRYTQHTHTQSNQEQAKMVPEEIRKQIMLDLFGYQSDENEEEPNPQPIFASV